MGKVLLAGAELGCGREALIVVAMAATDPVWITPRLCPYPALLHALFASLPDLCLACHSSPCHAFCLTLVLTTVCSMSCPFSGVMKVSVTHGWHAACRGPCGASHEPSAIFVTTWQWYN